MSAQNDASLIAFEEIRDLMSSHGASAAFNRLHERASEVIPDLRGYGGDPAAEIDWQGDGPMSFVGALAGSFAFARLDEHAARQIADALAPLGFAYVMALGGNYPHPAKLLGQALRRFGWAAVAIALSYRATNIAVAIAQLPIEISQNAAPRTLMNSMRVRSALASELPAKESANWLGEVTAIKRLPGMHSESDRADLAAMAELLSALYTADADKTSVRYFTLHGHVMTAGARMQLMMRSAESAKDFGLLYGVSTEHVWAETLGRVERLRLNNFPASFEDVFPQI